MEVESLMDSDDGRELLLLRQSNSLRVLRSQIR